MDLKVKNKLIDENYNWAKNKDWKNRANELLKILLNKDDDIVFPREETDVNSTSSFHSVDDFSFRIDNDILNYYIFKGNKKTSRILEISSSLSIKKNALNELKRTNFDITSVCNKSDNDLIVYQKDVGNNSIQFINITGGIESSLLSNLSDLEGKYDFVIVNENNNNNLVLFSVLNICFNSILKKTGIIGINAFDGLNVFIERNKDRINILKKDSFLYIEKM